MVKIGENLTFRDNTIKISFKSSLTLLTDIFTYIRKYDHKLDLKLSQVNFKFNFQNIRKS